MAAASVIGLLIAIGVAFFAAYDSDKNKIGFSDGPYTQMNGWLGWAILCFLLWIVGGPWYLIRRSNVMQQRRLGPAAWTSAPAPQGRTCAGCGGANLPGAAYCQWCSAPLAAGPAGTAMLIATFGPTTGWAGKTITREGDTFILQDHGPISAEAVMGYDQQGHLVWGNDGTRGCVASKAQTEAPGAFATAVDNAVKSAKVSFDGTRAPAQTQHGGSASPPIAQAATQPNGPAPSTVSDPPSGVASADVPATSVADEIAKLAGLHAKGILTDEEFAALKAKLM